MDSALRALSAEKRRHILALIRHEERTATDIAAEFAISRPAVSQHLKVLLDCDLILLRRAGTKRYYRVNQTTMAQLQAELASFWDDRLMRLKRVAERAERAGRKPRRR